MIRVEGTKATEIDEVFADAVASHQRLLAMLVERHEVIVDPDPVLSQSEIVDIDELEARLYKL